MAPDTARPFAEVTDPTTEFEDAACAPTDSAGTLRHATRRAIRGVHL
jgi:hypothetical protein